MADAVPTSVAGPRLGSRIFEWNLDSTTPQDGQPVYVGHFDVLMWQQVSTNGTTLGVAPKGTLQPGITDPTLVDLDGFGSLTDQNAAVVTDNISSSLGQPVRAIASRPTWLRPVHTGGVGLSTITKVRLYAYSDQ